MKQLLTLIISAVMVMAANAQPTSRQAAELYSNGDYQAAADGYRKIIETEGTNAALLYNLGNTYVKLGQPGNAMVCYQEALALDPTNAAIINNIRYLSEKVEDSNRALLKGEKLDVAPEAPAFMQSVQIRISEAAPVNTYGVIALGAFILMLAGIALYIFAGGVRLRKAGFFGAIICMVLTILFNVFAFTARRRWSNRNEGVITAYEAQIYPEPSTQAKVKLPKLKEGTVLEVQPADNERVKGWVKVRLNPDYNGWMQAEDLHML